MTTCTRRIEWDAAHRVLRHESKCATLHGHRYVALLTCEADELDSRGRVVDFSVLKSLVGAWVDEHWDHTTICNPNDDSLIRYCECEHLDSATRKGPTHKPPFRMPKGREPTAENIAETLFEVATSLLVGHDGLRVKSVVIYETPNCSAEYP